MRYFGLFETSLASLVIALLASSRSGAEEPINFVSHVAPILREHCVSCHSPGAVGPFSLLSFDDASKRARMIATVTASRFMPPWLPASDSPPFDGERRLLDSEIEILAKWAAAGAPRGEGEVALPPVVEDGWRLGTPDAIVEMEEAYEVPADGPEVFRNFVLRLDLGQRRFVRAVELRADNPRLIHHAILNLDPTDSSRRLDEQDDLPGYDGMQAFTRALSPDGHFVSWTPGKVSFAGYSDMAWELPRSADLVLETHLLPTGRRESLKVRLGLYFAEKPPSRHPVILRLGSKTIDIAAGDSAHRVEDAVTLPTGSSLLSVYPHAHYLCREMEATAVLPSGREILLLRIDNWDFNWQDLYRYQTPIDLPAGTVIRMAYTYDNSTANARNPHDPPRRVVYGPSSNDEMGDLWLQAVPGRFRDLVTMRTFLDRRESDALAEGFRKRVVDQPGDPQAHFGLGSELVRLGRLEEGLAALAVAIELDSEMASAFANRGGALVSAGRFDEAIASYRRAIVLDPQRPEAFYNLANAMVAAGRSQEALGLFDRSLELRPEFAEAALNKGSLLEHLGRIEEARASYRRAISLRPGYPAALYNLALSVNREGRLAEALGYLDQALDSDPFSVRVLVARGFLQLESGSVPAALASFRRALDIDPESAESHYGLGLSHLRRGDRDLARAAFERALQIAPNHTGARDALRDMSKKPER